MDMFNFFPLSPQLFSDWLATSSLNGKSSSEAFFHKLLIIYRMDCPKTLFRCQHFQVSGADLNPSSSSSHNLILSSNCTFDTIVVLVVMFITLGHSKNH